MNLGPAPVTTAKSVSHKLDRRAIYGKGPIWPEVGGSGVCGWTKVGLITKTFGGGDFGRHRPSGRCFRLGYSYIFSHADVPKTRRDWVLLSS